MKQKIGKTGELAWLLGNVLCALGVCLTAKSGFGVSIVVAPAYVIYHKISDIFSFFTFGMAEYILQGLILLSVCIILRKFKIKYILAILTIIFYGAILDVWYMIFGNEIYPFLWQRIVFASIGLVITTFAIALMLRTYLPQEAYEVFVAEISNGFSLNINKVKWIYDISSFTVAIILMLILLREFSFEIIGPLTIVCVFINSPMIAFFGKIVEKYFDFSPAFPKLYNILK